VHLAYGHRYQWFSLRTLTDILALTSGPEPVDWDLLIEIVRQSGTSGSVYWPLRLGHVWLGAPIPEFVLTRLAPPRLMRRPIHRVMESPYFLDGQAPDGLGASVLYNLVRELSLHVGCSVREQLAAARRCLFPSPDAVAHLPEAVSQSPLRYAAYLVDPRRVARGLMAAWRLMVGLPQPPRY
jgi:hypothetical protein